MAGLSAEVSADVRSYSNNLISVLLLDILPKAGELMRRDRYLNPRSVVYVYTLFDFLLYTIFMMSILQVNEFIIISVSDCSE